MFSSKWSAFNSDFLFWVCTRERRPVRPSGGWGGGQKIRGGGGFEWVILRTCAQCNLGARCLLRQAQSRSWCQFQFPDVQRTLYLRSRGHPGVRPRERDCGPVVNPTCNVQNGLFHFYNHDSYQSCNYDLGPLAHHPINQEVKRRKIFLLVVEILPLLVLLDFFSPIQKCIYSLCLQSLWFSISKPDVNYCFCLALL